MRKNRFNFCYSTLVGAECTSATSSPRRFTSLGFLSDLLDFVKDSLPSGDYRKDEDPRLYRSEVTGRGPLPADWLRQRSMSGASGGPVMCAYKMCAVEFKYWGMQTKIEKFIHDVGTHPH